MSILRWMAMGAFAAVALTACGNDPMIEPGVDTSNAAIDPLIEEGDVLLAVDEFEPEARSETLVLVAGSASWTMSGAFEMDAASSAGRTRGYSFSVPAEFEQRASGHTVTVGIASRIAGDGTFAVAYSTNEVGNSGWQEITASSAYTVSSIQYSARTMRNGAGDFVGIAPDPLGTGQSVEIAWIKLSIE